MRLGRLAVLVTTLAAASACATVESGAAFDTTRADGFQEGTATRQQIEAALGKPTSVTTTGDGRTILVYSHVISRANGLTGAGQADATVASFVVDAQGVLRSKTVTTTNHSTRVK